jgi:hypothetical protein
MKRCFTNLSKALFSAGCLLAFSLNANAELIQKIEAESGEAFNFKTLESNWIKFIDEKEEDENIGLISGGKYVGNMHPLSYLQYIVNVETAGTYELKIFYMDSYTEATPRRVGVGVNRQVVSIQDTPKKTFAWTGVSGTYTPEEGEPVFYNGIEEMSFLIYLDAGKNAVKVGGHRVDNTPWGPNMDYIELHTTDQVIPKPADIPSTWDWSFASEAVKVTSDHENSTLCNIKDNNEKTIYTVPGVKTTSVVFEFDKVIRLGGCLVDGGAGHKTPDIEVYSSTDKESWSNVALKTPTARNEGKYYECSSVVGEPSPFGNIYYKVVFTTDEDDITVSELQLFGFPHINQTAVPQLPQYPDGLIKATVTGLSGSARKATYQNGEFTATAGMASEQAVQIVDGLQAYITNESTLATGSSKYTVQGKTLYVQYDFTDMQKAQSYLIAVCGTPIDDNNAKRNPKSWVLEGSEDFGGTWVEIAKVENFTFPAANYGCMKFPITSPGEYFTYRMTVTANNGAGLTHMSEWQLYDTPLTVSECGGTSIERVNYNEALEGVSVYTGSQSVIIDNTTGTTGEYQLYNIAGVLIGSGTLNGTVSVNATKGVYIVKLAVNGQMKAVKVMVN